MVFPYPLSYCISLQQTAFAAVGRKRAPDAWFSALARCGYDGVELAVRDPAAVAVAPLRKALDEHGLVPVALGTGQAFLEEGLSLSAAQPDIRNRALERMRAHLSLAAELEIGLVVVGLLRGRTPADAEKNGTEEKTACLTRLAEALSVLAPVARKKGVTIALEPINRYETDLVATLAAGAALLDRVAEPGLGLLADTFHMNIEERDPLAALETFGERLVHFHVADSNRWAPGWGHLDLKRWFEALSRSGYRGYVSVECMDRPSDAFDPALRTLRKLGLGRRGTVWMPGSTSGCKAYRAQDEDNVAVAMESLEAGQTVEIAGHRLDVKTAIPAGHKVALCDIGAQDPVRRYGEVIGCATEAIDAGTHVHRHNLTMEPAVGPKPAFEGPPAAVSVELDASAHKGVSSGQARRHTFAGYRRPDGRVATRNELWIVTTVGCMSAVARRLARRAAGAARRAGLDGVRALTHPYGCSQLGDDGAATADILSALAHHPNAGAVLLLGLGCENTAPERLWERLQDLPAARRRLLVAQRSADYWRQGMAATAALIEAAAADRRTAVGLEGLSLGVKCGGSDGFSGVTANPLLGRVAERVAARNGQVLMGEVPEMFGAELGLARRAASRAVLDAFWDLVTRFRADLTRAGALAENPSPGNYAGGISTLAEKSLGCVLKAGRLPVQAVAPYGRRAVADGLTIVECPGNDLVSTTALVAAGANLIAFTTGRGTPMGSLAPTIKISSNAALAARHSDWIDFDGSAVTVCGGAKKRDEAAVDRLLAHILETAGGRPTAAESRDDVQLGIWKRGVTL